MYKHCHVTRSTTYASLPTVRDSAIQDARPWPIALASQPYQHSDYDFRMSDRHLEKTRTFAVSVEQAYDAVLLAPLPDIFSRRYLAIAPIREVTGQHGEWGGSIGQTRTIRLADGGTMLETLTSIDPHNSFGYSISNVTGLMKPLVAAAAGSWTFSAVDTGTQITWAWDVTPTAMLGRAAMPVFAKLWSGYARQAMDQIETILAP